MSENAKKLELLRIKNGRSKRCLDCKKNHCVVESCYCDCHLKC